MPAIPHLLESITRRQTSQPRTILGFLLGMFTVVVSGAVAVTIALGGTKSSWLIPIVLSFVAVVTVGLLIGVMKQAARDPASLMLGQITGDEYQSIRRLTMGSSSTGEYLETRPPASISSGTPERVDDDSFVLEAAQAPHQDPDATATTDPGS